MSNSAIPARPQVTRVDVVSGVVIIQDGKVLLVQEKQPKAYGKWNFPAGKVDQSETLEQAAIREAQEETGYTIALGRRLPVVHESIANSVLHAFAAYITAGELQFPDDEILAAKWFTPAEIRAMQADLRSPAYILSALDALESELQASSPSSHEQPTQYIYPEPTELAFDKLGHTGKFFGTSSPRTGHLIVETNTKLTVSLTEDQSEFNYYVIAGSGQFIINGAAYPIKAGDLIVIPPGTTFTWGGHLKMLLINTPRFSPEQEHQLPVEPTEAAS